jgi:hypothetical protein
MYVNGYQIGKCLELKHEVTLFSTGDDRVLFRQTGSDILAPNLKRSAVSTEYLQEPEM